MAGSRIKGITIEINGDSTKLQKALSGIDKSLSQTQAKLKDVDKLLKLDPKNTELLTQKQKALKDAVELTRTRIQALKEAQEGVAKGSEEWDVIQREIVANEQSLKELEGEYKSFGSVGAQQVAAVGKSMQELGGKISAAGQKMAPISGAAAGVVGAFGAMAYGSVTAADDLNTLAKQTGLSTDYLQKLKYSSDLIDVSMEDVTSSLTKMKKAMTGDAKAFADLGIEVKNADGSMRSVEDIFNDTVVTLSKIDNEVERDQAAMAIFGKSADSLAGIIDDGGEALKAYGQQAEDLGLIMSGDTLNSLNEINDAIDTSKAQVGAAAAELGATVAEGLLPLVEPLTQGIQKITTFLQSLTPEQTQIIMGIAAAIAVISPLLMAIGGVISAIGTVLTLAPVITTAIGAILSPVGLVVIAVAALAIAVVTHWEEIKAATSNMVASVKQKWDEFKQKIKDTWTNVKAAVSEAVSNVRNKFNQMKNNITTTAGNILASAKEKFEAVKTAIITPIENARDKIKSVIETIKGFFSNLKLKIPKPELPKLPHFSIRWSSKTIFGQTFEYPSGLNVDWYAKAMNNPYLFTTPTVMQTPYGAIGAGEAGAEVMYGKQALMRDISTAVTANNANLVDGMYVAMSAALKNADITVAIGRREFARLVREAL